MNSISLLIGVLFACIGCVGNAMGDEPTDELPPKIISQIKALLNEKAPGHRVSGPSEDGSVRFSFQCAEYQVHGNTLDGIQKKSRPETGPTASGFDFELTKTSGATGGEQGQPNYCGRLIAGRYWLDYYNAYDLPADQGQIQLDWNEGSQTDPAILKAIRKVLSGFGKEVYAEPDEDIEETILILKSALETVMKAHSLDVACQRKDSRLVCEFKTMNFDVHSVDERGVVKPESQVEIGPQNVGFIIRIRVGQTEQQIPRKASEGYGRDLGTYWHRYYADYRWKPRINNRQSALEPPFQLEILYGSKTDKNLLKAVVDEINQHFTPPDQF